MKESGVDASASDVVRLPSSPHVAFDRSTQVICCERCASSQSLGDGDDKKFEIECFAIVHQFCGETRSADHADRVSRALYQAGYLFGLGVSHGDVADACRRTMRGE